MGAREVVYQVPILQTVSKQTNDCSINLRDSMHFTHVVAISELVNIALEVFGGHLVINAVVTAFQQSPEGCDAICMCLYLSHIRRLRA